MCSLPPSLAKSLVLTSFLALPSWGEESLEYKLASLDNGGPVRAGDVSVARFKSLLRQLSETYVEDKEQIANMTVRIQQVLTKDGVKESLRNIMEGMNRVFDGPNSGQKYGEYGAAYAVLRIKGQSHREAVEGMRELASLGKSWLP